MSEFQWLANLQIKINEFILEPGSSSQGIIDIAEAASAALTPLITDALVEDIEISVGRLSELAPIIESATKKLEDTIAEIQATNAILNQIADRLPSLVDLLKGIMNAESADDLLSILSDFTDSALGG